MPRYSQPTDLKMPKNICELRAMLLEAQAIAYDNAARCNEAFLKCGALTNEDLIQTIKAYAQNKRDEALHAMRQTRANEYMRDGRGLVSGNIRSFV